MRPVLRKIVGLLLALAAVPFFIEGGLSRMARVGIPAHPNHWMLIPAFVLIAAALYVHGPKGR